MKILLLSKGRVKWGGAYGTVRMDFGTEMRAIMTKRMASSEDLVPVCRMPFGRLAIRLHKKH